MENNIIKYQKLTPTISDDISYYEEFLDYAYSEKDLLNIALTGPYGAGKSSVWKGYEAKKEIEDSTIHISLTNFNEINISDVKNEDFKDDNVINNISKRDINKIEFQILNQILYQIDNRRIPNAKYKVKQSMDNCLIYKSLILFTMFILGFILVIFEKQIKFVLLHKLTHFTTSILWLILSIILLLVPTISLFGKCLRRELKYFDIKKISFKNSQLEFDSDKEESLFDRDQDEIVYIIRESGIKTIVFEDLDRFNNIEIFGKLRIINKLTNINKEDEEKIRFVYMLRDDVFISKDRTKFFDYILPIVPILESSNARGVLLDIFEEELKSEYSPDKKMLERISIYIDDMRLLKNIYNEYIIYLGRIDAEKRKLDPNKLLGITVYKNIFPSDYEDLQGNKGYIYNLFKLYKKKISFIIINIEKEIELLNDEVTILQDMVEEDYPALVAVYFPTDKLYEKSSEFKNLKDFTKYLIQNTDEMFRYKTNNGSGYRSSGREILEEIDQNRDFKKKSELLKNNDSRKNAIKERKNKIQELEYEKKKLNSMTLKELLDGHIEQSIFEETDNKIVKEHYFPLIKFLVINGYIDETYREYLSYFYSSSITANDKLFLRSIYEDKPLEYDYRLDNPLEVLSNLQVSDFMRHGILNFSLLKTVVNMERNNFFKQILETINGENNMKFLNRYMLISEKEDKILFIEKQIYYDRYSLKRWINSEDVDSKNHFFVIDTVLNLPSQRLNDINNDNNLDGYLEANSNILDYYNSHNIKKSVKGMLELDVKFYDLSISNPDYEVLKEVVDNDLYCLNFSNINFIINKFLYSGDREYSEIISEQFTLINSYEKLDKMKLYIEDNFETYLSSYIENLDEDILLRNLEEDTLLILNSEIDSSLIEKFIEYNETIITNIVDIKNKDLWKQLLERSLILKSSHNVQEYYREFGIIDGLLLNFINTMEYNFIKEWKNSISKDAKLELELLNTENVNINIIEEIAKVNNDEIMCINTEISYKHLEILIANKKINMNEENLMIFNQQYNNYMISFIEKNIDDYIDLLDEIEGENYEILFSEELVYKLLNSYNINDVQKKTIIQKYDGELKISKINNGSVEVRNEVINTKLDTTDIPSLINSYDISDMKIEIQNLVKRYFGDINFNELQVSNALIADLIKNEDLDIDEKTNLICIGIENKVTVREIKNWLKFIPEMENIYSVFQNKRPLLDSSGNQYKIALELEELNLISLIEEDNGWRAYLLKKGKLIDNEKLQSTIET